MTDVINSLVITRIFLAYVRQNEIQVKIVKIKTFLPEPSEGCVLERFFHSIS